MLSAFNQWFSKITDYPNLGRLLLRLTIAGLLLFHGIAKLQHGLGGVNGLLTASGLPSFIGYGVYVGEILAPILVILGLFTRPAAFIIFATMVFATLLLGMEGFGTITATGAWGYENQALFAFGALVIMFLGSGSLSVSRNPALR